MRVYVTNISGFEDAFVAMYLFKGTWSQELDNDIRNVCRTIIFRDGHISIHEPECVKKFNEWMKELLKFGKKHNKLLRFIDISIMTEHMGSYAHKTIESYKDNNDIKRCIYMEDAPGRFISKFNLYEWEYIFRDCTVDYMMNVSPEVVEWAETIMKNITSIQHQITREYIVEIESLN